MRSNAAQGKGNREFKTEGMVPAALRRLDAGSGGWQQAGQRKSWPRKHFMKSVETRIAIFSKESSIQLSLEALLPWNNGKSFPLIGQFITPPEALSWANSILD
ncbi:MAG: hypothetical protein PHC88_09015 [Terrimicrobiaceae bacterium]|nr:hypothetical protein [Terrimicrobiaceae bacterium]